jgi:hypothetical protein
MANAEIDVELEAALDAFEQCKIGASRRRSSAQPERCDSVPGRIGDRESIIPEGCIRRLDARLFLRCDFGRPG